jgi:hypothetical protein
MKQTYKADPNHKKISPMAMAAMMVRSHGVKHAKAMVSTMLRDTADNTHGNLPVGPLFYEQMGPKDWRLKTKELSKVYNYWMETNKAMKKYKSNEKEEVAA